MPESPIDLATKEVAAAKKRVEVAEAVLKREQSALKAAEKKLADAKAATAPAPDKKPSLGLGSLYGTTREERREQMEMTEQMDKMEQPVLKAQLAHKALLEQMGLTVLMELQF